MANLTKREFKQAIEAQQGLCPSCGRRKNKEGVCPAAPHDWSGRRSVAMTSQDLLEDRAARITITGHTNGTDPRV